MTIKSIFSKCLVLAALMLGNAACTLTDFPDPNNPSVQGVLTDATRSDLQGLVSGIEAAMRIRYDNYVDACSVIGREYWRLSTSDPRYTGDMLGKNNSELDNSLFFLTGPYAGRYRAIKNANVLIESIPASKAGLSDAQKRGYTGMAKTLQAYQLLLVLNQLYDTGIRVDVANPDQLGAFVTRPAALDAIAALLDAANTELTGAEFVFKLSEGFAGFDDAVAFAKFNRALAARVDLYREKYGDALTKLNGSFLDLNGDYAKGPKHYFSNVGGDVINSLYLPLEATGEVRIAHPTYIADAIPTDSRFINNVKRRAAPITFDGLTGSYDVNVYKTNADDAPIIRNEELVLIYAEAKAKTGATADAVAAINKVRTAAGIGAYTGATTEAALIDEILYQRRYSLFGEGHRWLDLRRLGKLGILPLDRAGDKVHVQFPKPQGEN